MKTNKLFVVILALILTMSMTATAFAATSPTTLGSVTEPGNSVSIDVNGTYTNGTTSPTVYSVDVAWGAMNFTYTASGTNSWDPATHTYTPSTDGSWSVDENANKITLTNHSNAAVKAAFLFNPISGITGSFTGVDENSAFTLDAAAEGSELDSQQKAATLTITGGALTESKQIGTVTVTLSAAS